MNYYKMVGKELKQCSLQEWSDSWTNQDRQIGLDNIKEVKISTVCLGIEHSGGLFETMVFGGVHDQFQDRCYRYEEAVEMHRIAVELVKKSSN